MIVARLHPGPQSLRSGILRTSTVTSTTSASSLTHMGQLQEASSSPFTRSFGDWVRQPVFLQHLAYLVERVDDGGLLRAGHGHTSGRKQRRRCYLLFEP